MTAPSCRVYFYRRRWRWLRPRSVRVLAGTFPDLATANRVAADLASLHCRGVQVEVDPELWV